MDWMPQVARNSHSLSRAWEDLILFLKHNLPEGVSVQSALLILDGEFELPLGKDGFADRILLKEEDVRNWKNKLEGLLKEEEFHTWILENLPKEEINFN